eukprot:scaffold203865_cov19-Prasinocladus_malaysianus.AAC.2
MADTSLLSCFVSSVSKGGTFVVCCHNGRLLPVRSTSVGIATGTRTLVSRCVTSPYSYPFLLLRVLYLLRVLECGMAEPRTNVSKYYRVGYEYGTA